MNKSKIIVLILIFIFLLGFIPIWTHVNIFGSERINSYEFFGNCWLGDVRLCDYDPFN
ncbi:MAG: hypothetical protein UR50_C0002G0029 [Parcubacteria group bacterium GW2011_GWC1_34_10]|nr:MAG: hypothetical protein UR50_C0002G0029 [Parcubacteria group bacterium GW2011_GWC1_34_10]